MCGFLLFVQHVDPYRGNAAGLDARQKVARQLDEKLVSREPGEDEIRVEAVSAAADLVGVFAPRRQLDVDAQEAPFEVSNEVVSRRVVRRDEHASSLL
jgi:hypothetical protein